MGLQPWLAGSPPFLRNHQHRCAFPDPWSSQYLQTLTPASSHPSETGSQAGGHWEHPRSSPRPHLLSPKTQSATQQHLPLHLTNLQTPVRVGKGPHLFLHVKHFTLFSLSGGKRGINILHFSAQAVERQIHTEAPRALPCAAMWELLVLTQRVTLTA